MSATNTPVVWAGQPIPVWLSKRLETSNDVEYLRRMAILLADCLATEQAAGRSLREQLRHARREIEIGQGGVR